MDFYSRMPSGVHSFWRYILGFTIVIVCYALGQIPFYTALMLNNVPVDNAESMASFRFSDYGIHNNLGFVLLLSMFVAAMGGLLLSVVTLHRRPVKDILTASSGVRYRRIVDGFVFWLLLNFVFEAIAWSTSDTYIFQFHPGSFAVLFLICLVLLPIQTGFEELFFRGYLMQGMAMLTRYKWIPALISSIVFGLMHTANPEIKEYGLAPMLLFYISAGMFLAFLAVQDNGLELSVGVHTATNFSGAVLVNYQGSVLQTDALFLAGKVDAWLMLIVFWAMASLFMVWASRRYAWSSWRNFFE